MWAMYKCSKCLQCTSDISWLVIHVYGHCLLIVINSGQMYVYVTKRQNVCRYFVVFVSIWKKSQIQCELCPLWNICFWIMMSAKRIIVIFLYLFEIEDYFVYERRDILVCKILKWFKYFIQCNNYQHFFFGFAPKTHPED